MTSEEEKRLLLLAAIIRIGGSGTKKRVLDEIANAALMDFSDYDLQSGRTRNELNWRNDLAYIRDHLVRHGYVGEEWNNWSITERGFKYFESLASAASSQKGFQHIKDQALGGMISLSKSLALSDEAAVNGETVFLEGAVCVGGPPLTSGIKISAPLQSSCMGWFAWHVHLISAHATEQ